MITSIEKSPFSRGDYVPLVNVMMFFSLRSLRKFKPSSSIITISAR